jgi:hypothetical protein
MLARTMRRQARLWFLALSLVLLAVAALTPSVGAQRGEEDVRGPVVVTIEIVVEIEDCRAAAEWDGATNLVDHLRSGCARSGASTSSVIILCDFEGRCRYVPVYH